MSRRLDIFEYAKQHKDCPEHIREHEINGQKYVVHSHFVGTKDIDKVLKDIALTKAMTEVLYSDKIMNRDTEKHKITA